MCSRIGTDLILLLTLCLLLLNKAATTQAECVNGDVRKAGNGFVQYCYNGQWRHLCTDLDHWGPKEAIVACRQLGYREIYSKVDIACDSNIQQSTKFARVSECTGLENTLLSCTIENETMVDQNLFNFCNPCKNESSGPLLIAHGKIICNPANCANGEIRLVDGSTNREGRVEVCLAGRWGTICNNRQEGIAEAVCSQLGFPKEGAKTVNSTQNGWRQTYNCIWNSTYVYDCGEFLCDNSYLTVRCLTHQEVGTEECPQNIQCQSSNIVTPLGAVLGVVIVMMVAITIGWAVSCAVQRRGPTLAKKSPAGLSTRNVGFSLQHQEDTSNTTPPQPTYSSLGPSYSTIAASREEINAYDDVVSADQKENQNVTTNGERSLAHTETSQTGLSTSNEGFSLQHQEDRSNTTSSQPPYSSLGPNYSTIAASREEMNTYNDGVSAGRKDYQNVTSGKRSWEVGEEEYAKLKH